MKKRALARTLLSVTLSAAMIFAGGTTMPVLAETISDNDADNEDLLYIEEDYLSTEDVAPLTNGKVMRLASAGTGIQNGQHIYFGHFNNNNIYLYQAPAGTGGGTNYPYWRVLDNAKANDDTTGIFLMSETLWGNYNNRIAGGVEFNNSTSPGSGQTKAHDWQGSSAQGWCTSFLSNTFGDNEKEAIKIVNKRDNTGELIFGINWGSSSVTSSGNVDRVFFLSASEVYRKISNIQGDALKASYLGEVKWWWLRSPSTSDENAGFVGTDGVVYGKIVTDTNPVRPAFNLDTSKIAFTSKAAGGKATTVTNGGILTQVGSDTISDWKLTLKVQRDGYDAKVNGSYSVSAKKGEKIGVAYTNADGSGSNKYISAAILDSANEVLYYAPIKSINTSGNGTADLTIPSNIADGTYTLMIMNEECNGDYKTDYAAFPTSNITLTVPAYTVSYNANGHGNAPAAQNVAPGGRVNRPADPTADGWTFGGWYTEPTCTNAYNFGAAVNNNFTLYAKWTQVQNQNPGGGGNQNNGGGGNQNHGGNDPVNPADPGNGNNNNNNNNNNDNGEVRKDPEKVGAFVERMYQNVLKRASDENGKGDWSGQLLDGKNCGAGLAQGFILSKEFTDQNVSNEVFVDTLYATFFNRAADDGGKAYWLGELANGRSRTEVLAGFVNSDEFGNLCDEFGIARGTMKSDGSCTYNEGVRNFVLRCYSKVLGRNGETKGVEDWCNRVNTGELTMRDVAVNFLNSQEFINKGLNNEEYVKVLYRTFLGREADEAGLADWKGQLDRGEKSRDDIVSGFSGSQEFANIMAQYQ